MAETLTGEAGQFNVREDITDQMRRDAVATMAGRPKEVQEATKTDTVALQQIAEAGKAALQPVTFASDASATAESQAEIQAEADTQIGYREALGQLYEEAGAAALARNQQFAEDWDTVITATNRALDEYAAELFKQGSMFGRGSGGRGGGGRGGGGGGEDGSVVDFGPSMPQWMTTLPELDRFNSYLGATQFSRGIVGSHLVDERKQEIDPYYAEGELAPFTQAAFDEYMEIYRQGGSLSEAAASTLQGLLNSGTPPDVAAEIVQVMSYTWEAQWEAADRFLVRETTGPGIRSGPYTGYSVAAPAYANPQAQGGPPNTRTDTPPPPSQTAGAAYGGPPDTRTDVEAEQDKVTRNAGPV